MTLAGRVTGILLSPRATFERAIEERRWVGVLVLSTAIIGLVSAALLSTDAGQLAWTDPIRDSRAASRYISDEQLRALEARLPLVAIAQALLLPVRSLLLAGVIHFVFRTVAGSQAAFVQVFTVVAHALVVPAFGALVLAPWRYARESLGTPLTLAAFLQLDDTGFLARILGSLDLFFVWWAAVLALGLAVLYRRRVAPVALAVIGAYTASAVVISAIVLVFESS